MSQKLSWSGPPLIGFMLLAAGAVAAGWLPSPWRSLAPDECRGVNCYCEPIGAGFVAQPVAAYSSLGFVLVGFLILALPRDDDEAPNLMSARPAYGRVFGLACVAAGFGSFFYHASLTRAGEWFDLVGTYLMLSGLLLYNLARLRPAPGGVVALTYLALNGALGVQMIVARQLQQVVFGALTAGAVTLELLNWLRFRPRARYGYLAAAVACFGVGAWIWALDARLPCVPDSLLQWHAVWHGLAATAALLLFAYYRSEREGRV